MSHHLVASRDVVQQSLRMKRFTRNRMLALTVWVDFIGKCGLWLFYR